jgi:hypothetical protein
LNDIAAPDVLPHEFSPMTDERLNLADLKLKSPADLLSMAEELGDRERLDHAQGRDDVLDPARACRGRL